MSNETNHEVNQRWVPIVRRRVDWQGLAMLIGALLGLWLAASIPVWHGEPSTGNAKLYTAIVVLASVVVLARAISRLMSSARSRLRHVFFGRRVLMYGGFLLMVAMVLAGLTIRRDPLGHFFGYGRIDAGDIVDSGFGVAFVVCMVGARMALIEGRETLLNERYWHRSLGISLG